MDEKRLAWLALNLAFRDNPRLLKKAIGRFRRPEILFKATEKDLGDAGLDSDRVRRVKSGGLPEAARKEFDRLAKKRYSLLTLEDKEYPACLKEIFNPPCVLYCSGRTEALDGPAVAIVGTRRPSPYGKAVAARLSEDLASRGVVIISGLALGVDSIAHWAALREGRTVAVLGSGLDNPYPRQNRKLMEKIADRGAVVSEFPLDTEPFAQNFPRRNRVISGLSRAVIVVEAAEKSGSLITAEFGLEQNREVMAVPGNVTSDLSRGTNALIQAGAKLVRDWMDVAEELGSPLRESLQAQTAGETRPLPLLTEEESSVYKCLRVDARVHIDELLERTGLSVSEMLALLLNLEIKGLVTQSHGKHYQRRM